MKKYLKQIIYDLKTQPVVGAVSIIGTAVAIMLVMVLMMTKHIQTAAIAPESNRDRLLYEYGLNLAGESSSGSSHLSLAGIDHLYGGLTTPEVTSVMSGGFETVDTRGDSGKLFIADMRRGDDKMWKIFDHKFIYGTPYSEADVKNGKKVVVLTESLARKLTGNPDAVGKTIFIKQYPYTVVGVVKDVSPLMGWSYAQLWTPVEESGERWMRLGSPVDDYFGDYCVVTMAKSPEDVEAMRQEIRSRSASFNSELEALGWQRIDTDSPYTQDKVHALRGTNRAPDTSNEGLINWILIAIVLLVPAINLSSMTQSRLRNRRHEVGVRRAFGATKGAILRSIMVENLIVTLIGGAIGLVLTFIMSILFTSLFYEPSFSWGGYSVEMSMNASMLFSWSIFGWALLFCFILNLLSAGIPSWRAANVNPVDAINGVTN